MLLSLLRVSIHRTSRGSAAVDSMVARPPALLDHEVSVMSKQATRSVYMCDAILLKQYLRAEGMGGELCRSKHNITDRAGRGNKLMCFNVFAFTPLGGSRR